MLTFDQLDPYSFLIMDLYEDYMQSVINDIVQRLVKMGRMTDTAAWQMMRLTESGKVYENALKEIAKLTGMSEVELRKLFTQMGVRSLKFDDSIYIKAGLKPLPLNLSPAMADVLAAGLRKTKGIMQNLTMTTAINAQRNFIDAADLAYLQVSSGAFTYDQAIRQAVKSVASKGLSTIEYGSGHVDQLDVAMRRAVLTGVAQTVGELQMTRADELSQDLVQTSAHIGARPTHQEWQGRIFSRSGKHKTYPDFVVETGYGTMLGLHGINCRHSFYPFFEGISENAYKEVEIDDYAAKTVKYNGNDISIYDATQIQRNIERRIRYWKRQVSALEASGLEHVTEGSKINQWQLKARLFVSETKLQRQNAREQIQ